MPIIFGIIVIAVVVGFILLGNSMDSHWVKAESREYRIYQVHGNMWHCWKYRLQKKSLWCWVNVLDEYDAIKDSDRYNGWIAKYKMEVVE